jgi:hypothetical protein
VSARRAPDREAVRALEVRLVPVGDHGRVPVRRLAPLSTELASHGRNVGLFDEAEPLALDSTDESASAASSNSGIALRRNGLRSAWSALPRGAVPVEEDVVERLEDLMTALLALDLSVPDRVAPVVALVRAGSGWDHGGTTATAEEAFTLDRLRDTVHDVARQLAARLLAAFRREVR